MGMGSRHSMRLPLMAAQALSGNERRLRWLSNKRVNNI